MHQKGCHGNGTWNQKNRILRCNLPAAAKVTHFKTMNTNVCLWFTLLVSTTSLCFHGKNTPSAPSQKKSKRKEKENFPDDPLLSFPYNKLFIALNINMTMLMTENSFTATSLDCEVSNRKRRRVEDGASNTLETNSTSTATSLLMVNPVTQQFNRQNMVAPDFNCSAVLHNEITRLQLSNLFLRYKAVVLFFYGCDL